MIKTIQFDEYEYYIVRMKEFKHVYLLSVVEDEDNGNADETEDIREAIKFENVTDAEGYISQLQFPDAWEVVKITVQYKIS